MRALRILLIVAVILGGLFVIADRVAVGFAEDEAAQQLKTSEGLTDTPSVSIKGFPFLTQVAGGELDEVEVGIKDYEAKASGASDNVDSILIDDLTAKMTGVSFSSDFSSATAATATGTATVSYDELLKAAKSEPTDVGLGFTARVVGLSDGGNGKIKVAVEIDPPALEPETVTVLSTVSVKDDKVEVEADSLPDLGIAESAVRSITDFQQAIDDLPGDIKLDKVEAASDGVEITVKGSNVRLAG
ncbi:LmeA family phospholipid-binding protein [Streptomyces sp. NPDC002643]